MRKASVAAAGACLLSLLLVPDIARADNCGSLLGSINQLKAQIPREPRDAANDDRQVLNDYVAVYNRACIGGGSGGGAPSYRGGSPGNNAANALGAAANALGALGDLLDQLDQENQAEEAARQQQLEDEQEQEAIEEAQRDAAQRAAAAQARAAAAQARAADDAQRQALANPFGSSGGSNSAGGGNPFDTPKGKGGNPFATTAAAAPPPAATKITPTPAPKSTGGASQNGFKTDAQIKSECASSGNPSMCELTETGARSSSPAYKKYVAARKATIQKNVNAAQRDFDDKIKEFDRTQAQRKPPESIGSLPAILAGLPVPNDDGLECGPAGYGRRHGGQCFIPTDSPNNCAAVGGTFYPADDDHPASFCATSSPANPMTAHPGPHEGEQCGDVAGHIHGGACWALGITRDDCHDLLKGITLDNGGFQYCAYDADQLAREQAAAAKAAASKRKVSKLRDDLAKKLAGDDADDADDGDDTVAPTKPKPPVQPVAAKQDDAPPAAAKEPWKPDYACRLADDTVIHTDDPHAISGWAIDHPPDCHLINGAPMLGLTGSPDGK